MLQKHFLKIPCRLAYENIHGHPTSKSSRKLVSMVTTWPGCLRYAFLKEVITCFWFRLGKPYFNDVLKFNQGLPQVVKILVTMAPKMYLFFLPFFSRIAYPFSYFNVLQVSGSFRDNSIGKIKINFLISRLVIITNKEVSSFS